MTTLKKRPTIYLAGPDVFLPNSIEHGEHLKAVCEQYGFDGLYPLDNQLPDGLTPNQAAKWIAEQNIDMIRRADYVLTNLSPFRGHEPDSGTCFEFGMAIALGKPVVAYFDDHAPMVDKVPHATPGKDADGLHIEDFGLPVNLMMATTWNGAFKTFPEALAYLRTLHLSATAQKAWQARNERSELTPSR